MERATGTTAESTSVVRFAAPQSADAIGVVSPESECSDEQRSTPEDWWLCIDRLRRSGQAEAAELELEQLQKSFPDFPPPL